MPIDYRAAPLETQVSLLARSLPSGRVWNAKYDNTRVLGRLVRSAAMEIQRLFETIENFVLVELDPARTHQLILEWEKSVGIPDRCFGRAATLEARRAQLGLKLANFSDPITRADIEGILALLGEPIDIVPGREIFGDDMGFGAGPYDADEVKQIRHTMIVRVGSTAVTFPLTFPLPFGGGANTIVECLVRRLLPANVAIQFLFGEDLSQPYRGVSFTAIGTTITGGTSAIGSGVPFSATGLSPTGGAAAINLLREIEAEGLSSTDGVASINVVAPEPNNGFFTGQELWFKADAGITDAGGGVVSDAAEQFGLSGGRNLTQADPAKRPTISTVNGNVSILHDGSNDVLGKGAFTAPFSIAAATVAFVVTPTSLASTNNDLFRLRTADLNNRLSFRRTNSSGDTNMFYDSAAGTDLNLGRAGVFAAGATRWVILRVQTSGTCDILTSTGLTASGTGPADPATAIEQLFLGANEDGGVAWTGHWHEFVVFSALFSTTQRDALARYFASRWILS